MKKLLLLALLISTFGIASAQEKNLKAYFSYANFLIPDQGPFVETYLAVEGKSVVFAKNNENDYQASIEVVMIFRQKDEIKNFAKYELHSPVVNDTLKTNFGFIDQQRFSLPNGDYDLEIKITDVNSSKPGFNTFEKISLNFSNDSIQMSGIQLVEEYNKTINENILSKSGYDLVPMVYAFYPESANLLNFYCEVYHTDKVLGADKQFMVNYYIESFENSKRMLEYFTRKKMNTAPAAILLQKMDISKLPSGNYRLVVEVRNAQNKLEAVNKIFFQRSNPKVEVNLGDIASVNVNNTFASKITQIDTLKNCLLCLAPISTEAERNFAYSLITSGDVNYMQKYLYNFWYNRNNLNPTLEWEKYYNEVRKVNAAYKTPTKKGFQTDRGRVYLKYGPPNLITESYNEPGAYPYEIWQYYTLDDQRNKRFVFYSKDMVTNDFVLIHSDAIGELSNYRWQLDIYKRTWDPSSVDDVRPEDSWGNKATDYYKHPR